MMNVLLVTMMMIMTSMSKTVESDRKHQERNYSSKISLVTNDADFTYTTSNNQVTITGYKGPGGHVVVPGIIDGMPVVAIGYRAFQNKTSITSISLPDSITTIGEEGI